MLISVMLAGCTPASLWVLSHSAADPPLPATRPATRRADPCPERTITAIGQVQDPRLREVSGLTASRRHPGLFYVHNDSGDAARVFLIDRAGQVWAEVALRDANAVDYEAIAIAPGTAAASSDVCVADIGDNDARRQHLVVYRFPEIDLPSASSPGPQALSVPVKPYALRYEDGPANAEAFLVHPRTGDGYILTKRTDGRSAVYLLPAPWPEGSPAVLRRVAVIEFPPAPRPGRVATAADVRPDGRAVAVRCYAGGWEWRLSEGASDQDFWRIFERPPCRLELAGERQGEALCYSLDGTAILTISEGLSPVIWEHAAGSSEPRP